MRRYVLKQSYLVKLSTEFSLSSQDLQNAGLEQIEPKSIYLHLVRYRKMAKSLPEYIPTFAKVVFDNPKHHLWFIALLNPSASLETINRLYPTEIEEQFGFADLLMLTKNPDLIEPLYRKHHYTSCKEAQAALDFAALFGNLHAIKHFVRTTDALVDRDTLCRVALSGHMEAIHYVVEECNILPDEAIVTFAYTFDGVSAGQYLAGKCGYGARAKTIADIAFSGDVQALKASHNQLNMSIDEIMVIAGIHSGDKEVILYLLSNYEKTLGKSTLMYIGNITDIETVDLIISRCEAQPDVDVLNPVAFAGAVSLFVHLVDQYHIAPNKETMRQAATAANIAVMKILKTKHALKPDDDTLRAAASIGNIHALRFLIDECGLVPGSDVLDLAAKSGCVEAIRYLGCEKEVIPNIMTERDSIVFANPFHPPCTNITDAAIASGNLGAYSMVESILLGTPGALLSLDKERMLIFAARSGSVGIIDYLFNVLNAQVNDMRKLLADAVFAGKLKMVKYLVMTRKIRPTSNTLLNICQRFGHTEIEKFLRQHCSSRATPSSQSTSGMARRTEGSIAIKSVVKDNREQQSVQAFIRSLKQPPQDLNESMDSQAVTEIFWKSQCIEMFKLTEGEVNQFEKTEDDIADNVENPSHTLHLNPLELHWEQVYERLCQSTMSKMLDAINSYLQNQPARKPWERRGQVTRGAQRAMQVKTTLTNLKNQNQSMVDVYHQFMNEIASELEVENPIPSSLEDYLQNAQKEGRPKDVSRKPLNGSDAKV